MLLRESRIVPSDWHGLLLLECDANGDVATVNLNELLALIDLRMAAGPNQGHYVAGVATQVHGCSSELLSMWCRAREACAVLTNEIRFRPEDGCTRVHSIAANRVTFACQSPAFAVLLTSGAVCYRMGKTTGDIVEACTEAQGELPRALDVHEACGGVFVVSLSRSRRTGEVVARTYYTPAEGPRWVARPDQREGRGE